MDMLTELLLQYPIFSKVLMVMGILRLTLKPSFSILHSIVDFTKSPVLAKFVSAVEASKAFSAVSYVLDWFGSIKSLPPKK